MRHQITFKQWDGDLCVLTFETEAEANSAHRVIRTAMTELRLTYLSSVDPANGIDRLFASNATAIPCNSDRETKGPRCLI